MVRVCAILGPLFTVACTGAAQNDEPTSAVARRSLDLSGPIVAVTREATVAAPVEDVFDFVAAEDVLPKVLTGYGLVPAVESTTDVTGPWDRPGSSRVVHLADGSTARESIVAVERPNYFAYRVSDPTFALGFMIEDAHGEWWFDPVEGGTKIRWTYTFRARSQLSRMPLALFAKSQWAGYMAVCLNNVQHHFEAPPTDPEHPFRAVEHL